MILSHFISYIFPLDLSNHLSPSGKNKQRCTHRITYIMKIDYLSQNIDARIGVNDDDVVRYKPTVVAKSNTVKVLLFFKSMSAFAFKRRLIQSTCLKKSNDTFNSESKKCK